MKHATTAIPMAQGVPVSASARVPAWKRVLDVAVIIGALPLLIPLSAAIALLIKCVSRGPVLFKQERIGLAGKPFVCFKFRTMKVDAPTVGHQEHLKALMKSDKPMTKLDSIGDRRLIPFGGMLR